MVKLNGLLFPKKFQIFYLLIFLCSKQLNINKRLYYYLQKVLYFVQKYDYFQVLNDSEYLIILYL